MELQPDPRPPLTLARRAGPTRSEHGDDSGHGDDSEHGDDAVILLVGVSPVYAHGACAALVGSGMRGQTVATPASLRRALERTPVRVVVFPQALAGEVQHELGAWPGPHPRLVVLVSGERTRLDTTPYRDALRAGGVSLVGADAALPELVAVLAGAARGYTCMPPDVVLALCQSLPEEQAPDLLPQERAWLRSMAAGTTVAELATRATYSEREMYRRLGALYRRLGAGNRREALFAAQRSGLLAS